CTSGAPYNATAKSHRAAALPSAMGLIALIFAPTADEACFDPEEIEDSAHAVVHDIVQGLRLHVECRNGRGDDRAHLRQLGDHAQMPQMERRFAQHED